MRIAIITDIHEDFRMLEKAIGILNKQGFDILVCLGDITGYSPKFHTHAPDANACVDMLKHYNSIAIAGNHDLFTVNKLPSYYKEKNMPDNWYQLSLDKRKLISNDTIWIYEDEIRPVITEANKEFIAGLPEHVITNTHEAYILFSHFLYPDVAGVGRWFPSSVWEISKHFKKMKESQCNLSFVGHSHPYGATIVSKLFWKSYSFKRTKLGKTTRVVFCPAVVESTKPSGAIIFDTKNYEIIPVLYHIN